MSSFNWTDHFVTGLPTVDEQHRHLVDLVNDYGRLLSDGGLAAADPEALLGELYKYADEHFRDEDVLMRERAVDPRHFEAHKEEHQRFLADVGLIAGRVLAGDTEAAKSLLDFLMHWLAYHILVQDQNMARQIAVIDSGATPSEAYETQEREAASATGPLVVALSGLFHQVSEQNLALLELNQSLEAKVQERTRALTEANQRLEDIAMSDALTGLPNRRHGLSRLAQLWAESAESSRPLSCLMIDADGFKQINDTQGHDAGDVVLRTLARELKNAVRTDDVVCRLGGDEFLVICPNTDQAGAQQVGEQLRSNVAAMHVKAGQGVWHGSVSVGVGTRAAAMREPEELLKAADEGVYAAKRDGRNCVRLAATTPEPVASSGAVAALG